MPEALGLHELLAVLGEVGKEREIGDTGGNVTFAGVIALHVKPLGIVSVKVTTPAKPFSAITVTVKAEVEPTTAFACDVAVMLKSLKVKVDEAE